jgi:hypothetical protein
VCTLSCMARNVNLDRQADGPFGLKELKGPFYHNDYTLLLFFVVHFMMLSVSRLNSVELPFDAI